MAELPAEDMGCLYCSVATTGMPDESEKLRLTLGDACRTTGAHIATEA